MGRLKASLGCDGWKSAVWLECLQGNAMLEINLQLGIGKLWLCFQGFEWGELGAGLDRSRIVWMQLGFVDFQVPVGLDLWSPTQAELGWGTQN